MYFIVASSIHGYSLHIRRAPKRMLLRVKLQDELAHVSHFETCCFGVAMVSHRTENISWGMMTFHKIIRIAEHPSRADQSTMGAINRPLQRQRNSFCYFLESTHQSANAIHVAPVEDTTMDNCPATLIVAANSFCQVTTEIVIEPGQVSSAKINVIHQHIGIAPDTCTCVNTLARIGHNLHYTDATIPANNMLIPAALLPGNCQQQTGRKSEVSCRLTQ